MVQWAVALLQAIVTLIALGFSLEAIRESRRKAEGKSTKESWWGANAVPLVIASALITVGLTVVKGFVDQAQATRNQLAQKELTESVKKLAGVFTSATVDINYDLPWDKAPVILRQEFGKFRENHWESHVPKESSALTLMGSRPVLAFYNRDSDVVLSFDQDPANSVYVCGYRNGKGLSNLRISFRLTPLRLTTKSDAIVSLYDAMNSTCKVFGPGAEHLSTINIQTNNGQSFAISFDKKKAKPWEARSNGMFRYPNPQVD